MAIKLSEFLAQHNVKLEDLEDDEVGLPLPEVRKRLKENQDSYTKGQQALKDFQRQAEQNHAQWQQAWQAQQQENLALQQRLAALQEAGNQAAQRSAAAGQDWRRDPLFLDIAAEFDRTSHALARHQEGSQAIAKAVVSMAEQYTRDRQMFANYIYQQNVREMKRQYEDFDAEAVSETAKKYGINDWEAAYKAHKADRLPGEIENIKKQTREETLKEAQEKFGRGNDTEMGGGPPAPAVSGGGEKVSYDKSFENLASQLKAQGIS